MAEKMAKPSGETGQGGRAKPQNGCWKTVRDPQSCPLTPAEILSWGPASGPGWALAKRRKTMRASFLMNPGFPCAAQRRAVSLSRTRAPPTAHACAGRGGAPYAACGVRFRREVRFRSEVRVRRNCALGTRRPGTLNCVPFPVAIGGVHSTFMSPPRHRAAACFTACVCVSVV